tara:strand:+ start:373 stop:597 length:225 start_codon:yes stop_codon:yes gene_type:complete
MYLSTYKGEKNMSENSNNTQIIANELRTLNKILSCLLTIAIKDSTLKTMTTADIEKVMPVINSVSKTVSENINV